MWMRLPLPSSCRMRSMSAVRTLAVLLAASAVTGCGKPHGSPVRVIVPRGSTFAEATDSLSRNHVVGNRTLFRAYARLGGKDRNIKPGTYLLQRGTPWPDIISALHGGEGLVNTVTIPEGFALSRIAPLLATRLRVPRESVDVVIRDSSLRRILDIPSPTLEGYLFPDTYAFPEGMPARTAVTEMVRRFQREWKPEWNARARELTLNRNDIVTLASIIEKEVRLGAERPVVSAVYHNRLRIGMLLQADPTVQYALGRHVERVLYRDLEVKSPYNTYINPGLPPGPIASPGGRSIEAALYPANVKFLYFVAFPDGHHEFTRTLSDHDAARIRARAAWNSSNPSPARTLPTQSAGRSGRRVAAPRK